MSFSIMAIPVLKASTCFFYLLMAYGVTKVFGQGISRFYGVSLRVNVYEHKNFAAAMFIAAFTLATGIVFGGSLWGEADPLSDAEGGLVGVSTGTIIASYYDAVTTEMSDKGKGEPRDTGAMKYPHAEDTCAGWDFNNVWSADIDGTVNDGYPYLKAFVPIIGEKPAGIS